MGERADMATGFVFDFAGGEEEYRVRSVGFFSLFGPEINEVLAVGHQHPWQRRVGPRLAAVGRDFDFGDLAGARPGQSRDVVQARTAHVHHPGRVSDHRFDAHGEAKLQNLAIGEDVRVFAGLVLGMRRRGNNLKARCPFHKFAASQAAARLYGLGG